MLHRQTFCALALCFFSSYAFALEVGLEALLSGNASDNIGGSDRGEEVEGQLGYAQFSVYGDQQGRSFKGAFSGEILTTARLDGSDNDATTITQFLGAVEAQITPRAFSWYVGDILGSVTTDDGFQTFDETADFRRNVFATGPEFTYELDGFSRVNARFLYVNQSQNDENLEDLYNTVISYSVQTDNGNTFGFNLGNIFTDNPDEALEGDFNRFSLAGVWSRTRGRTTYEAQLGGTRFDTEDDILNGLNARLSYTTQLGPQTNLRFSFLQDLTSQSLDTVETLLNSGTAAANDGDGFFDQSRFDARYSFTSSESIFDIGTTIGYSDFRLLRDNTGLSQQGDLEDRVDGSIYGNYAYIFSPRTRLNTTFSVQKQEFINRDDNSQSFLGTAQLVRSIGRSFEILLGYRFLKSDGLSTNAIVEGLPLTDDIDVTANRVTLGIRWAPPTRASRDLTIELKSLLQ